jgi:hypothetical protein
MRALRLFLMLSPLIGCGDQATPGVCTALFAMIPLTVQTQDGVPASGLTISATIVRTGQTFTVPQIGIGGPGTYVVFDDNFLGRIRASGDSVRVTGSDGTLGFAQIFLFDAPGGCHVQKVAGPDMVVAQ